jgi:ribonuclease BN (tRNA processing enzyme)
MCDGQEGGTAAARPTRRALIGSAAVVGAAALGAAGAPGRALAAPARPDRGGPDARTRLVLLGTAGGPVPIAERFGISSAVVVGDRTYLFDAGRGSASQYVRAGLPLKSLRAVFMTHLHADHTADLFNYLMLAQASPDGDALVAPVEVFGPGPAGAMGPPFAGPRPVPDVNPDNPTPGLKDLINGSLNANAYTFNIYGREGATPLHPESILKLNEIDVSHTGADPLRDRAPRIRPFTVFEDDRIRVQATLGAHGLVFPAFGFRCETPDGVITFSGDTAYHENIIELAHRSDVLVHEAVSVDYYADKNQNEAFIEHLKEAHTDVTQVGDVARRANAGKLVLSHLGPAKPSMVPDRTWYQGARKSFPGPVVVGNDLITVPLRKRG